MATKQVIIELEYSFLQEQFRLSRKVCRLFKDGQHVLRKFLKKILSMSHIKLPKEFYFCSVRHKVVGKILLEPIAVDDFVHAFGYQGKLDNLFHLKEL